LRPLPFNGHHQTGSVGPVVAKSRHQTDGSSSRIGTVQLLSDAELLFLFQN
jgi:hypothetical protein